MTFRSLVLPAVLLTLFGCSGGGPEVNADLTPKTNTPLNVQPESFKAGQSIPSRFSAEGGNVSPAIAWSGQPDDTKSITLICDDPDANHFVHWVLFNVPPGTKELPAGLPNGASLPSVGNALQGQNGHGDEGYFGPKPPPGPAHHYHFHVYALDTLLPLKAGASRNDVLTAMSGHVLADGEAVGLFQSG